MMTVSPTDQPERRPISPEEVLKLRRYVWSDGKITPDEASQLFQLNDSASPSNDWADFFIEAICDYLIGRGQPRGYVTDADADWLMHHINHDGRIDTHAELELIVKLFERAENVPQSLKRFALTAIQQTVLMGEGPTRRGGEIAPGRIDDSEVSLIRRLIFAPAGDGPAKVSRSEAEMLSRLKDATLGANNSPEWQQLFVQGIANHLMAHQPYVPPSSAAEAPLDNPRTQTPFRNVLEKIGRNRGLIGELLDGEDLARRLVDREAAAARDAEVTPEEAEWLGALLAADGARDPLEQALLDFLAEDGIGPF
ncbi:MAG: hypothetical protein ACJ8E7_07905 [Sphingomicrobium sp.]